MTLREHQGAQHYMRLYPFLTCSNYKFKVFAVSREKFANSELYSSNDRGTVKSVIFSPFGRQYMNQLGTALRSLRVFHDLSLTDTAEKLEISKSYLSEVESGRKEPTLALLSRYTEVFSVPMSSLLFFAEQLGNRSSASVSGGIAPKVLRLLDWIAEVKPADPAVAKKPPQKEISQRTKILGRVKKS